MAEATLNDLIKELRTQHVGDRKSMRDLLRDQMQEVGRLTTTGVLAEAAFDRLKFKIPVLSGLRAARKTAASNKALYKSRIEGLVEEGKSPADAAKIAKMAGPADADSNSAEKATSVNTARTATAVEKMASSLAEFVRSYASTINGGGGSDEPFGFADRSSSSDTDETAGGGDTAKASGKSKIRAFAKASSKSFGKVMGKINDGAQKMNIFRNRALMGTIKKTGMTIVLTIASAIASVAATVGGAIAGVAAALAPFMVPIAAGIAAVSGIVASILAILDVDKEFKDIEKMEADSEKKGKEAIDRFRVNDAEKDLTLGDAIANQRQKVLAAQEAGDDSVAISIPGGFKSGPRGLKPEQALAILDGAEKAAKDEGILSSTGRQIEDAQAMERMNRDKALLGNIKNPLDWADAEGYTSSEYMAQEVKRLKDLKASGAVSAKTIKDPILLANPFAVDDAQLFQEMDIDKAINIAEGNLSQTQTQGNNYHIGMTRRKLKRDGMMKGEGPLFDLLNKSADEMASERMGRAGAFASGSFGIPGIKQGIGEARDMRVNANALRGDVAGVNAPSVNTVVADNGTTQTVTNTTNVESGHMTDSPSSLKEMQHAN